MQQSQHVWVDGSLRDGPYYAQVMADLRAPARQFRERRRPENPSPQARAVPALSPRDLLRDLLRGDGAAPGEGARGAHGPRDPRGALPRLARGAGRVAAAADAPRRLPGAHVERGRRRAAVPGRRGGRRQLGRLRGAAAALRAHGRTRGPLFALPRAPGTRGRRALGRRADGGAHRRRRAARAAPGRRRGGAGQRAARFGALAGEPPRDGLPRTRRSSRPSRARPTRPGGSRRRSRTRGPRASSTSPSRATTTATTTAKAARRSRTRSGDPW